MKSTKKKLFNLGTELKVTGMRLATGDATALTKSDKIVVLMAAFIAVVSLTVLPAFAAGTTGIFGNFNTNLGDLYGNLVAISTVVAAVGLVASLIWLMVSPGSKGAEKPIGWIKKILLAYFGILIIGGLFKFIEGLAKGYGWSTAGTN